MISIILVMIGGGFGAIARSAITDYFNHNLFQSYLSQH